MKEDILIRFDKLQKKIEKLVVENFEYHQKMSNFEKLLMSKADLISDMESQIADLKRENEQLKVGKAFVGNDFDNEEAKKRIDSLIKEINLCILTLKQ